MVLNFDTFGFGDYNGTAENFLRVVSETFQLAGLSGIPCRNIGLLGAEYYLINYTTKIRSNLKARRTDI